MEQLYSNCPPNAFMQCFRPSTNHFTFLPSSPAPDLSSNFTEKNFKSKHCIYSVFQSFNYRFYIFDPLFPNKLKCKKNARVSPRPIGPKKSRDGKNMAFDCIYHVVSHCCSWNVKNVIYIFQVLNETSIITSKMSITFFTFVSQSMLAQSLLEELKM